MDDQKVNAVPEPNTKRMMQVVAGFCGWASSQYIFGSDGELWYRGGQNDSWKIKEVEACWEFERPLKGNLWEAYVRRLVEDVAGESICNLYHTRCAAIGLSATPYQRIRAAYLVIHEEETRSKKEMEDSAREAYLKVRAARKEAAARQKDLSLATDELRKVLEDVIWAEVVVHCDEEKVSLYLDQNGNIRESLTGQEGEKMGDASLFNGKQTR